MISTQLALAEPVGAPALVRQAQTDAQLVDLWLHGRSVHTQAAYRRDVARFFVHVPTPLVSVTLGDVQAFAADLGALAPASQARTLAAIKSLLAFGHRIGYLPLNVGAAHWLPEILPDQAGAACLENLPNGRCRAGCLALA